MSRVLSIPLLVICFFVPQSAEALPRRISDISEIRFGEVCFRAGTLTIGSGPPARPAQVVCLRLPMLAELICDDCAEDTGGTDADGDGFFAFEDCDDTNASINPDAEEVCDYVDNDCDGIVDGSSATDATAWYQDSDNDGFGDSSLSQVSCIQPAGYVYYDGDCDDSDIQTYPGAIEVCWDLIDNDCDGYDEICEEIDISSDAHFTLSGGNINGYAGFSVSMGDVNADGYDDILIGAHGEVPGSAYLFHGPLTSDSLLSYATSVISGDSLSRNIASVAVVGDVNADGYNDMLFGIPGEDSAYSHSGSAYLVYGALSSDISLVDADTQFTGVNSYHGAGTLVAGAGDVNSDGYSDMLVYATSKAIVGSEVYIVHGPQTSSMVSLSAISDVIQPENAGTAPGNRALTGNVDFDADGVVDLIIGDKYNGDGGSNAGAAYIVSTDFSGTFNLSSATAQISGQTSTEQVGYSVSAGDVNGDGYDDPIIGAPGDAAGAAYIFFGPVASDTDVGHADFALYGNTTGDETGSRVHFLEDVNADSHPDILIGAMDEGTDGAAFLVMGPVSGSMYASDSDTVFSGDTDDALGYGDFSSGDVNSDGYQDTIIGSPYSDFNGSNSGAAFLMLGSSF